MIDTTTFLRHVPVDVLRAPPRDWFDLLYNPFVTLAAGLGGALVGGRASTIGAVRAMEVEARTREERTYRHLRVMFADEVVTVSARCVAWATTIRETRRVEEFHIYQLQVRMELYDRSIVDLAVLPEELRRGLTSWYQDVKASLWIASDVLRAQSLQPEGVVEKQRNELVNRLDRLAERGNMLNAMLTYASEEP